MKVDVRHDSLVQYEQTDGSITLSFESIVRQHGERLAVVDENGPLHYDELNRRSNRAARHIASSAGAEHNTIALLLEQGSAFITGMLATLKAGRCLVPLDPNHTHHRNTQMLSDSMAGAMVTNKRNLTKARKLAGEHVRIIDIDQLDPTTNNDNLQLETNPQQAACFLYTSGSTGKPKAVVHTHRNLCHNVLRHNHAFQFEPRDRQSLLYPCSVYGGVRDILNALLNGASLHHYPVRQQGVDGLAAWLIENKISVYCSVVTIFRHLVTTLTNRHNFPQLRAIKLGGEAPATGDIDSFKKHFADHCVLHCGLASTETGMTLHLPIRKTTAIDGQSIPLGAPAPGVDVLLLNQEQRPIEMGQVGEIAIRSRYIAREYFNRPELSSKVFINDDEECLFLTGDLGIQQNDGMFHHRGRKDRQFKIRGNRIEPGEIERALRSHEAIRDAAVMPDGKPTQIIAFVVPERSLPSVRSIRKHLAVTLNDYMIPSLIVEIDAMPQTPNGKIDRAALTNRIPAVPQVHGAARPRTDEERALVEIWKSAFNLKTISIHDDFFELGGHSLLAVRIFAAIDELFSINLPLATLIDTPTIAMLSTKLADDAIKHSPVVALQPHGDRRPFFCVHGIGGEVLYFRPFAAAIGDDQPVYVFQRTPGDLENPTIETLAARYIEAMREVQPDGPYFLGGYSFGGSVALEMAQQLRAAGQAVDFVGIFDHIPANAPGKRNRLTPGGLATLTGNVPCWIWDDLLHTPPGRMAVRARGVAWGFVRHFFGNKESADNQINLARWFGVSNLPENEHRRFQSNYEAGRKYRPKPYAGRVTIFRSRAMPLLKLRDIVRRWRLLADDVDAVIIPGSHGTMFTHPHVLRALIERLRNRLDQAENKR